MSKSSKRKARLENYKYLNVDLYEDEEKAKLDRRGLITIGCLMVFIIIISIIAYTNLSNYEELDEYYCSTKNTPKAVHIMLLDTSDPLSVLTKQWLLQRIKFENFKSVPTRKTDQYKIVVKEGEQIQVWLINHEFTGVADFDFRYNPKTVFRFCNPATGKDKNIFTYPKYVAKKRWMKFKKEFDIKLISVLNFSKQKYSPILNELKYIVTSKDFDIDKGSKNYVYILTDFMEHTKKFSMYRNGVIDFDGFKSKFDLQYRSIRANYNRAQVMLGMIDRSTISFDNLKVLQKFWIDYFTEMNANVILFKPL